MEDGIINYRGMICYFKIKIKKSICYLVVILFTTLGFSQTIDSAKKSGMPEIKIKIEGGFSIANNFGFFASGDYFFKPKTFWGIEIHGTNLYSEISKSGMTPIINLPQDNYTSYMVTVGGLFTNPNNIKQHLNFKIGLGVISYDKIVDYETSSNGLFSSSNNPNNPIRKKGIIFGTTIDFTFQKIGESSGFLIGPYLNVNSDRSYAGFKIGFIKPFR